VDQESAEEVTEEQIPPTEETGETTKLEVDQESAEEVREDNA